MAYIDTVMLQQVLAPYARCELDTMPGCHRLIDLAAGDKIVAATAC